MNEISVITPPDLLLNDSFSICVICADTEQKQAIHDILLNIDCPVNVYVYDTATTESLTWLINVIKISDFVLFNLDACDFNTKQFASHIIAQANCFYLTTDNQTPYNLISRNRIYDLAILVNILNNRGKNE